MSAQQAKENVFLFALGDQEKRGVQVAGFAYFVAVHESVRCGRALLHLSYTRAAPGGFAITLPF